MSLNVSSASAISKVKTKVVSSELAGLGRKAGLRLQGIAGIHYDPIRRKAWLNARADVNYLMHFTR